MASYSYISSRLVVVAVYVLAGAFVPAYAGNFTEEASITWGHGRGKIINRGKLLTLSLDNTTGSGFESKNEYLFGKIDMQIKLVPDDSAGTVAAFFLKSPGSAWDGIDFEFLGNLSGDPYTVHTNVFTEGNGNREQQFRLWFDPSAKFHTYSILWNNKTIAFFVNGTPMREYRNLESKGVAFPKSKPMRVYSSLWNADDWATRGGLVKTNWNLAPFIASYRNYNADACVWSSGRSSCSSKSNSTWLYEELDAASKERLKWVQEKFMIYNYCTDIERFPKGLPPECLEK